MVSFWTACFLFYHLAIGIPWGNVSQLNIIFSMLIEICMNVTYKSEPFARYGMDFWCIVASMGFQLLFGLKKKYSNLKNSIRMVSAWILQYGVISYLKCEHQTEPCWR